MSTSTLSSRKFIIVASYAATIVLLASIAWQPAATSLSKSSRLAGPETQTAFLMERFGNPQRMEP